MNLRTSIFLTSALLITGCANKYVNPQNKETASLTLSVDFNGQGGYVIAQAFDDEKCTTHPNGTRLAFFGTMVDEDPHDGKTVKIDATKEFVFTYSYNIGLAGMTTTTSCNITTAFWPEPGASYNTHFWISAKGCRISFNQVGKEPSTFSNGQTPGSPRKLERVCFNPFSG